MYSVYLKPVMQDAMKFGAKKPEIGSKELKKVQLYLREIGRETPKGRPMIKSGSQKTGKKDSSEFSQAEIIKRIKEKDSSLKVYWRKLLDALENDTHFVRKGQVWYYKEPQAPENE